MRTILDKETIQIPIVEPLLRNTRFSTGQLSPGIRLAETRKSDFLFKQLQE